MRTVNLTPSTLAPSLAAGERPTLLAGVAAPTVSEACAQATFHGIAWTYCPGAEAILASVRAGAWADPAAQGWQCAKRHARREVWRATIAGQPYYLKYYFRDSWLRRPLQLFREPGCRTEWEGGLFTRRAGICAAQPVAFAPNLLRGARHCALLVSAAIEPAQALSDFWLQVRADDDPVRRRRDVAQLCEVLAELIARAHQAGFEHLDMHAANVLVQSVGPRRYRVALVDLQSARRDMPVSDRAVVRNLAQLNQWFRRQSSVGDRLRFLRAYIRWRNEFEPLFVHGRPLGLRFPQLVAALQSAARRHAGRLGAQRDRRVDRDGRYFTRLKLPGGWQGMAVAACKHATDESRASRLEFTRDWWCARLTPPLRWFAEDASTSCKDSHSAQVRRALLELGSETIPAIIKHPLSRNWRRRLTQLWPPSRSLRGWRIGHALLHRDVPTARPLAVLERRIGLLVLDSLLITEAIPGAVDLETFLRREHTSQSPAAWVRLKRELSELLARHVRRLQDRGFEHRDCKAGNILVVRHPCLKLLWIDMDGLRLAGRLAEWRRWRPLVDLHVSLQRVPGVTRTDRVRFLKAYLMRFGSAPDAWRAVWRGLEDASAERSRAKEAHRAWKLKHYGRE